MTRLIPLTALASTAALVVAGCSTTREDVQASNEVAQETQEAYVKDKALHTAGVIEQRIDDLDGKIVAVRDLCQGEDGLVKAEYADVIQAMETRQDALQSRARYLRENADEMADMEVQDEWESINGELDEIDARLSGLENQVTDESNS